MSLAEALRRVSLRRLSVRVFSEMKGFYFICQVFGYDWWLDPKAGCIFPIEPNGDPAQAQSAELQKYWIGNPPTDPNELNTFVAVCNMAVAKNLLRPVHIYAVAKKEG